MLPARLGLPAGLCAGAFAAVAPDAEAEALREALLQSVAQRLPERFNSATFFSLGAVVATASKLAAVLGLLPAPLDAVVGNWGGLFAIALPVAAVGFLSWAAASDLEARARTYADMHAFLAHQVSQSRAARTARDFARLVRETEAPILEENLNWFSRRLFTSVA
jgi:hypothetical protein